MWLIALYGRTMGGHLQLLLKFFITAGVVAWVTVATWPIVPTVLAIIGLVAVVRTIHQLRVRL